MVLEVHGERDARWSALDDSSESRFIPSMHYLCRQYSADGMPCNKVKMIINMCLTIISYTIFTSLHMIETAVQSDIDAKEYTI